MYNLMQIGVHLCALLGGNDACLLYFSDGEVATLVWKRNRDYCWKGHL